MRQRLSLFALAMLIASGSGISVPMQMHYQAKIAVSLRRLKSCRAKVRRFLEFSLPKLHSAGPFLRHNGFLD